MASNYDLPRLFLGQAVALAALIASLLAASQCVDATASAFIPLAATTLAYGAMMFASSYVEEEHHFWYWATTAWLAWLGIKGFRSGAGGSSALRVVSTTAMLLATRVMRRWNQTGQKFAGEPDIVKMYLNTNPVLLWCLIGATYFWIHQNLVHGLSGLPLWLSFATATGLALAAFTFKVAFALEDAPELVTDFARELLKLNFTDDASLVARARAVFMGLGLLAVLTVGFMLARRRISSEQSGMPTLPPFCLPHPFFFSSPAPLFLCSPSAPLFPLHFPPSPPTQQTTNPHLRRINALHPLHPPRRNPVPPLQHPPPPPLRPPPPPPRHHPPRSPLPARSLRHDPPAAARVVLCRRRVQLDCVGRSVQRV